MKIKYKIIKNKGITPGCWASIKNREKSAWRVEWVRNRRVLFKVDMTMVYPIEEIYRVEEGNPNITYRE